MTPPLARRAFAEFLGTGSLVAVVVGSGIEAQRLSTDTGLQLLENAVVTAAALPVLILVFGPVSGGHFNPIVSGADYVLGHHRRTGLSTRDLAAYVTAQIAGAVLGALLANAMFAHAQGLSSYHRSGTHLWLSEVVATAGLLLVIISLGRSGRPQQTPWAVGAYIGAAYWFTSSTSFANPAVAVGRIFSNSFAGIAAASVPGFVIAEFVGGAISLLVIAVLYPDVATVADDLVITPEVLEPGR